MGQSTTLAATTADDPVAKAWEKELRIPADETGLIAAFAQSPELDSRLQLGQLLADIRAATGVQLPLTVVYASPTAGDLAEMARTGHVPAYQRPVKMQPGAGHPLFVLPGIGGIGLEVLSLIRHLDFAGPIYFNPSRGLEGAEPCHSLDEAVADQLACIKAVQAEGPYWLLGYSWGGLLALEIARSLRASGETIGFLGMIDPVLSQVDWTYGAWAQYIGARFSLHLKQIRRSASLPDAARYTARLIIPVFDKIVRLFGVNRFWPLAEAGDKLPAPLPAIWTAESEIVKLYRLHPYDGPVTLFATSSGHAGEVDPGKIWPFKVRRLDLHWVPGDHDLTEPGVAETAKAVSATLAEAKANA